MSTSLTVTRPQRAPWSSTRMTRGLWRVSLVNVNISRSMFVNKRRHVPHTSEQLHDNLQRKLRRHRQRSLTNNIHQLLIIPITHAQGDLDAYLIHPRPQLEHVRRRRRLQHLHGEVVVDAYTRSRGDPGELDLVALVFFGCEGA